MSASCNTLLESDVLIVISLYLESNAYVSSISVCVSPLICSLSESDCAKSAYSNTSKNHPQDALALISGAATMNKFPYS